MLVDQAIIKIRAGKGGDGSVSFRREKYISRGGPDGGDGGDGGNIIFECSEDVNTLSQYARIKSYKAEDGKPGSGQQKTGKGGKDLILQIPPGTIIYDTETKSKIVDLTKRGQKETIVRGGKGGLGNTHFKSATHQAPREFKPGEEGEEKKILLELKMIADVGIIGLPNSGKSTLLSTISNAKPKAAAYPFTTTEPVLGRVEHKRKSFIAADIPGLIEGASLGKGLGHKFLRHITRTKILIHLIDACSDNPKRDYETVRKELSAYNTRLEKKEEIIVINKTDQCPTPKKFKYDISISAISKKNIDKLLDLILEKI
jgi:GTP-binding protein